MKTNALILLIATAAFLVAPFLTPPFTGYDPAQFRVFIERPSIQPAGYAFAIWSVIYLWLVAHAAFGLWKRGKDPAWNAVRPYLTIAVAVGAAWLWIAGQSAVWGTVTIWIMAVGANLAFLRADTSVDRWLLSGPIAIFAGWLSAAAAVSSGVVAAGCGCLTNTNSALAMLALVLVLTVVLQWQKPRMPVYGLTVVWALVGVMVANMDATIQVAVAAAGGGVVMLAVLVLNMRRA
jgi:hypothetical protein